MRSKLCFLCVLGTLLLLAANVNAQVKAGSLSVTPFAGYSMFSYDDVIEDASTYGGSLGYNFSENFGIEVSYNNIDTKVVPEGVVSVDNGPPGPPLPGFPIITVLVPGGAKVTGDQWRFEGIFYIYPGKKLAPYAAIGIGQLKYDYADRSFDDTNVPLGFGFKYFVTENIALRADFRDVYFLPGNNLLLTAGVTFQLGGK